MKTTKSNHREFNVMFSLRRYVRHVVVLLAMVICLAGSSLAQGVAYIQELQPPSSTAGVGDFTLTVTGVNFESDATVKFDGTTLAQVSACSGFNQCKVTVTASLVAAPHTAVVTVTNGTNTPSNGFFFPVGSSTPVNFKNTAAVVGAAPQAIAVADLNNDKVPDLIIVNSTDNNISVLLGNGDGTFKKPDGTACGASLSSLCPTYPTGHNPQAVVAGDFDNDGKLDLVVANRDDNTLSFFKGDGTGAFASPSIIDVLPGVAPIGLVTEDLDYDGNLDLFVINQTDQNCSSSTGNGSLGVLFGDGTGKFSPSASVANICLKIAPLAIAAGDVDNDTDNGLGPFVDFEISSGSVPFITCPPGDGTVTVVDGASIYNLSHGLSLSPPTVNYFCAGPNPGGIVVGDFNNDGVLDVGVTNSGGKFAILLNTGNGVFGFPNTQTSYVTYPAGTNTPTSIIAGDFNGDHKVDVAMADEGGATVAIANGNGDGTFGTSPVPFGGSISSTGTTSGGSGPIGLVAADFNGDGKLDIATANHNDNPGSVTLLIQNSQPQLTVLCDSSNPNPPSSSSSAGCVGPPQAGLTGPPNLLFGNVVVGSSGVQLILEVRNDLSTTATYSAITNSNFVQQGTDFTQANTCGTSLGANATCSISVTFSPQGPGDSSATLKVPGLNGSFQFVSVSGTGIEAATTFNPQALAFGQQLVNAPSVVPPPQLSATLTNTGDSPLGPIGALTSATAEFTLVTDGCSSKTLQPNDVCDFTVSFSPTQAGLRTGTIKFPTNLGSISFGVYGQGTVPNIRLSNPPLLFSNQQVGTTAPPQTIIATNIGNGQLFFADNVAPFALTGTNALDFSQLNDCPVFPAFLDVNGSCTITITFTPLEALPTPVTARIASLVVTDNNNGAMSSGHPSAQQNATLNGSATAPVVSYSVVVDPNGIGLNFGGVPITTTSAAQSFVISNVGTAPLAISSVVTTNTQFNIVGNTCPAKLAVNTNCTVTVNFTPAATGLRTGTIVVTDNDRRSPSDFVTQTVDLAGTGTDFTLTASPASITISAGKTATYKITLNPISGFNNSVTYSCNGGPTHSNCFISGIANGSATIILSTSKGVNHGTFPVTFTATYTPAAPAGGPPGASTLAHSTTASITVK